MPNETTVDLKTALEMAVEHHREGRIDEAKNIYLAVLRKLPRNALANFHLGAIRQTEGDFDDAAAKFRVALQQMPADGRIHLSLVRCKSYQAGDPHIGEMEGLLAGDSLDATSRIFINFALAKVYDDLGDHERAFEHSRAANDLQDPPYDPRARHEFVDRLIGVFDRDFFRRHADVGSVSDRYVFIVGLPRTGTTLVDQIVSSHPNVHSSGELLFFHLAAEKLAEWMKSDTPYPECLKDCQRPILARIIETYHSLFRNVSGEKLRITNKFPENFRVLGLIGLLFPKSRVIRCVRDPMDVGLSIYNHHLPVESHPYSCRLEDIGHYTLEYERLMAHWRDVMPTTWHEVRYESLIEDREAESKKLIEFLGLDWDDRCIDFQRNRTRVTTESMWQVRQPVYTTSLARWKKFERQLAPLRRALDAGLAADGTLAEN